MLPEGGGAATQIDNYVKYSPMGDADELRLPKRSGLKVKATHHASVGDRFVLLDDFEKKTPLTQLLTLPDFTETATGVRKDLGLE